MSKLQELRVLLKQKKIFDARVVWVNWYWRLPNFYNNHNFCAIYAGCLGRGFYWRHPR